MYMCMYMCMYICVCAFLQVPEGEEVVQEEGEFNQHYEILKQIGKGAFGCVKLSYRYSDGLLVSALHPFFTHSSFVYNLNTLHLHIHLDFLCICFFCII